MANAIKSLLNQTLNAGVKAWLEVCVPNRRVRRVHKGQFAQWYLGKYVRHACAGDRAAPAIRDNSFRIWQYWEQGEDQMPELVRVCMESVERFSEGAPRVLLTDKNIGDYVEIPGFIYDLRRRGKIKTAHFSDILRTWLLVEHGGMWIDATVLQTAHLPRFVKDSGLFFLQNDPKADLDGLNMASYFLCARPFHKIFLDLREAILAYWRDNNFLVNYFAFLHMFTLVCRANEENRALWREVPFLSFIPAQHMQDCLTSPFDARQWEALQFGSPLHKLTHKWHLLKKGAPANLAGTFYDRLIRRQLPFQDGRRVAKTPDGLL